MLDSSYISAFIDSERRMAASNKRRQTIGGKLNEDRISPGHLFSRTGPRNEHEDTRDVIRNLQLRSRRQLAQHETHFSLSPIVRHCMYVNTGVHLPWHTYEILQTVLGVELHFPP